MKRIKLNIIIPPSPFSTPFLGICCSMPDSRKKRRNLLFSTAAKENWRGKEIDKWGLVSMLGKGWKSSLLSACPAVEICTHLDVVKVGEVVLDEVVISAKITTWAASSIPPRKNSHWLLQTHTANTSRFKLQWGHYCATIYTLFLTACWR